MPLRRDELGERSYSSILDLGQELSIAPRAGLEIHRALH
jgi:hypothetical protein